MGNAQNMPPCEPPPLVTGVSERCDWSAGVRSPEDLGRKCILPALRRQYSAFTRTEIPHAAERDTRAIFSGLFHLRLGRFCGIYVFVMLGNLCLILVGQLGRSVASAATGSEQGRKQQSYVTRVLHSDVLVLSFGNEQRGTRGDPAAVELEHSG